MRSSEGGGNPAIDALFVDYNRPDVPGASVIVIRKALIVYARAYGFANLEEHTRASTRTNYRLASLTKQFTAMAVMMLAKDGKLHFDDRLTDALPGFPAYGSRIRIRHLLNHTSGLWDYEDLIPEGQKEQLKDRDALELVKAKGATYFEPGSRFKYSNTGYATLALVVETASGRPFARFLKERIFQPLGMDDTVAYEKGISEVSNRAYGYTLEGAGFKRTDQSLTSAVLGDGGIYTSVMDLYKWDRALYSDRLVDRAILQLAVTPATLNDGSKTEYGFGWFVDRYRGRRLRYRHNGETVGFENVIQRFPEEQLTVIILANRTGAQPWKIAEKIADRRLP
ncbi:MAG: beta-lactamase family protein [Acidobacteria bacterium]|nr:beta-lactamase family protein [Acidobacteriota bacterium]